MHCQQELEALAREYGTETLVEPVARARAVLYSDVEGLGADRGCLDAIEASPNKVWVGK